jgi:DNA processing protein
MDDQNLLYQIGITLVKGIGNIIAKQVIETLGDVSLLFKEKAGLLERIPGISRRIIAEIHRPDVLLRAEKEVLFIEKNKIQPLFIKDKNYPERFKECIDAPPLLYFRGNADLNTEKIISVVGTRNASNYGKEITEKLLHDISETYPDTLIVSGLAYGIDICSHKAALKNKLPTVGVLAHGLDRIYPPAHRNTAVEMLENGGLLTDFISETNPDRQNFVKRNRIVAGISDCTIVIESAEKGGALITSSIADTYNKDVFAIPGKVTDVYSSGCNSLIKQKKAALITCAEDLFREMCWDKKKKTLPPAIQRSLFVDLNPDEQLLVDLLSKTDSLQLNIIAVESNMPVGKLAALLFELEMKGIARCMPGGLYRLVNLPNSTSAGRPSIS